MFQTINYIQQACADCIFADFDGNKITSAYWGGKLSLVDCTFQGNTILGTDANGAVILADAGDVRPDTEILLDGVAFKENTTPVLLADNRGADTSQASFYGDISGVTGTGSKCVFDGADEKSASPVCESLTAKGLSLAGTGFLTTESPWLLDVQEVRWSQPALACSSGSA